VLLCPQRSQQCFIGWFACGANGAHGLRNVPLRRRVTSRPRGRTNLRISTPGITEDLHKNNFTFSAVRGTAQALAISTFEPDRPCATRWRHLPSRTFFAPLRLCEKPKKLLGFRFVCARISLAKTPGRKGKLGSAGHFTERRSVPNGCLGSYSCALPKLSRRSPGTAKTLSEAMRKAGTSW
jgi:hypothetical protein